MIAEAVIEPEADDQADEADDEWRPTSSVPIEELMGPEEELDEPAPVTTMPLDDPEPPPVAEAPPEKGPGGHEVLPFDRLFSDAGDQADESTPPPSPPAPTAPEPEAPAAESPPLPDPPPAEAEPPLPLGEGPPSLDGPSLDLAPVSFDAPTEAPSSAGVNPALRGMASRMKETGEAARYTYRGEDKPDPDPRPRARGRCRSLGRGGARSPFGTLSPGHLTPRHRGPGSHLGPGLHVSLSRRRLRAHPGDSRSSRIASSRIPHPERRQHRRRRRGSTRRRSSPRTPTTPTPWKRRSWSPRRE